MGGRLERGKAGKKARELGMLFVKIPVVAVFSLLKQEMSYYGLYTTYFSLQVMMVQCTHLVGAMTASGC